MSAEVRNRLVTYALLGQMFRESLQPKEPCLELTSDGWQIRTPERAEPIPVSVKIAYEASGGSQEVLDETRKLCGTLRLRKRDRAAQRTVAELRKGLAEVRAVSGSGEEGG